jgi:hypothetical protein
LSVTFDVIVAGDIIEHLNNIGNFLHCLKRHMTPETDLILTTPNPFDVERFIVCLIRNAVGVNPDHTVWLDPVVMWRTLDRAGLRIVGFTWTMTRFRSISGPGVASQLARVLSGWITRVRPAMQSDYAVVVKLS